MQKAGAAQHRVLMTQANQSANEVEKPLLFGRNISPVQPINLIILAIGVVIALLAAAKLVPRQQHRRTLSQQYGSNQVTALTLANLTDCRVRSLTLNSIVVTEIGWMTITVVFAIDFIVTFVVADQIGQGEPIMAGHIVDRRPRSPEVVFKQVAGSQQVRCQTWNHAVIATPEAAHRVAEPVIPFSGASGETTQLVTARTNVPRLRDHFNP